MQKEGIYQKYGAMKEKTPVFMPDARGMLLIKLNEGRGKNATEDDMLAINLHAQGELRAQSDEYARAQEWWSNLPKTPARQMENYFADVDSFDEAGGALAKWISGFTEKPGLVYVFEAERTYNVALGCTHVSVPEVMVFSPWNMSSLDDVNKRDCITYRLYYAYYERPETLTQGLTDVSDDIAVEEENTIKI